MSKSDISAKEQKRLEALKELSILDTLPEKQYDDITKLASDICETPVSQITLVDAKRQWYKSNYGVVVDEVPREIGFCSHTILEENGILIVQDLTKDSRFVENPFVSNDPYAQFYAGVALKTDSGHAVGSLCVIDMKPKVLSNNQIDALKTLANIVTDLFELHRNKLKLNIYNNDLKNRNEELTKFASIAAHDIKSPLNNIISASNFIQENAGRQLDEEVMELLTMINKSSQNLSLLITDILEVSKNSNVLKEEREIIFLNRFIPSVFELIGKTDEISLEFPENDFVFANKTALQQIFINLIVNAHKHNDKKHTKIEITFEENDSEYCFSVIDNGPGIPEKERQRIFELFEMNRKGGEGYGIGLATVKRLVTNMAGSIRIQSEIGKGSKFIFSIGK